MALLINCNFFFVKVTRYYTQLMESVSRQQENLRLLTAPFPWVRSCLSTYFQSLAFEGDTLDRANIGIPFKCQLFHSQTHLA